MKERKFNIGDIVEVDKENRVEAFYTGEKGDNRVLLRHNHDRQNDLNVYKEITIGVITGLKRFVEGKYYPSSTSTPSYYSPDYDIEPGGVIHEKTITCWAVRTGYLNKEIYFFEEDITEVDPIHRHDIPTLDTGWTKKAREDMSRWSKGFGRDAKGRFA
jgi:hypothetical protein